jgi:G:T-mismatch repair DNA endonuclease (very short patch repair protein)
MRLVTLEVEQIKKAESAGFKVITLWESQIKGGDIDSELIAKIQALS